MHSWEPGENEMSVTGTRAVVDVFIREGVECVFSLPGTTLLDIYDEIGIHLKIRHIIAGHEQGAAHMADGLCKEFGQSRGIHGLTGAGGFTIEIHIPENVKL
jgi:acetolactate synthase-1/2/3 large subunit